MKHVKLFEQFIQEEEAAEFALPEAPASTEGTEGEENAEGLLSEDEFKALVTKLVTHELAEEGTEEKEGEEVSEGGLTKEELEKVNAYIAASWVPSEEPNADETGASAVEDETLAAEPTDVNEIFGLSAEEKSVKLAKAKEAALASIMKHPNQSKVYQDWKKKDAAIADKYVEFVATHPGEKYFQWDDAKKAFVAKGLFKVASGEGTAGK